MVVVNSHKIQGAQGHSTAWIGKLLGFSVYRLHALRYQYICTFVDLKASIYVLISEQVHYANWIWNTCVCFFLFFNQRAPAAVSKINLQ